MSATVLFCLAVAIADGDTLTARCGQPGAYEQVKVRLDGIDAPERQQPFAQQSRQALSRLVFRQQVRLECAKIDRYRRHVCTVWVPPPDSAPDSPPTLDAGLALVTQGMAWWYRAYAHEQTPEARGQYAFAEDEARARRVGLWADPHPTPPWEWRRMGREKRKAAPPRAAP